MAKKSRRAPPNPKTLTKSGTKRGRKNATTRDNGAISAPCGRQPRAGTRKETVSSGRRVSNLEKRGASASNQAVTSEPPTKRSRRHPAASTASSDTSQSTTRRSQRTPSTADSAPVGLTEADIPRIVQEVLKGMPQARGNNSVHNDSGPTVEDDEFSEDDSIGKRRCVLA